MNQVWVGYEDVAFTPGSLTREEPYTELLRDGSGVPLLCGTERVYVSERGMRSLSDAAKVTVGVPSLKVRSDLPEGHRQESTTSFHKGLNLWVVDTRSINVDLAV